jgi:hypothetical protein
MPSRSVSTRYRAFPVCGWGLCSCRYGGQDTEKAVADSRLEVLFQTGSAQWVNKASRREGRTGVLRIVTQGVMAVPKLRRLVSGFPQRKPGFEPRSGDVGFVVNKVALGQVFSDYFGFPCQVLFHRMLNVHHHLSSGAGTIGQFVADVPNGLSLTPPPGTKN